MQHRCTHRPQKTSLGHPPPVYLSLGLGSVESTPYEDSPWGFVAWHHAMAFREFLLEVEDG